MNIAIVYNLKKDAKHDAENDEDAEFDDITVPNAIKSAIHANGFENVDLIEFNEEFLDNIRAKKYDFVYNVAEGLKGESRESQVPAILEMLQIKHSAGGTLYQAITLDKGIAKQILRYYKIPTPNFQVIYDKKQSINPRLKFPLVVKPNCEGSSKGITQKSLVNEKTELKKRVHELLDKYKQPVMVEEFLPGREFTVAVLGNDKPYVLPIVEIFIDKYPDNAKIYHFDIKFQEENHFGKAEMESELRAKVYNLAVNTYKALGCKDLSRIDIRCDKFGEPQIIEVNCLPGLNPNLDYGSYFPWAAHYGGLNYDDIVTLVLFFSFERYKIQGLLNQDKIKSLLDKLELVDLREMK
jgi:D-alanine-D-alanine ligase